MYSDYILREDSPDQVPKRPENVSLRRCDSRSFRERLQEDYAAEVNEDSGT